MGYRKEWEWNKTKEKWMGNGRHNEKSLTLDWQIYIHENSSQAPQPFWSHLLQESSLPALTARAMIMLSAGQRLSYLSAPSQIPYHPSQRESSICWWEIWLLERCRRHWMNYPGRKKLATVTPPQTHQCITGPMDFWAETEQQTLGCKGDRLRR